MAVKITSIQPNSPASRAGIESGETLISLNGHAIHDILDYRFYETTKQLSIVIHNEKTGERTVSIRKGQYDAIGLEFDSYLMDQKRTCRNKCMFCFIDQMPKGMRDTLYFKDDDTRLSFLFGNYVTLTNLTGRDVERMIEMHISPINVSVHTTNPDLRVKMMGNRFAGQVLDILPRLAEAGIKINCQCVLCPGINDGEELRRTLSDLEKLTPSLQSVALVPVGVTKYRAGLAELRPYTPQEAADTIDIIDRFGDRFQEEYGERIVYAADEFYLKAGRPVPPPEFYGDFSQLESGVGSLACLQEEFTFAWQDLLDQGEVPNPTRKVTLATGMAARDFIKSLLDGIAGTCHNLTYEVIGIVNEFFGETITVAGLVTGTDLARQLQGRDLGDALLIPSVMLRHEGDVFLDDISLEELSQALKVRIVPVANDGQRLLEAVLGSEERCQNQS